MLYSRSRLWPDLPPAAALNALYEALHGVRRVLEPAIRSGKDSSYVAVSGASRYEEAVKRANALGDPACAARLYGSTAVARSQFGTIRDAEEERIYERHLAATRAALPETAFAAAWEAGEGCSLDQAIAPATSVAFA